jgi:hypothetical protein
MDSRSMRVPRRFVAPLFLAGFMAQPASAQYFEYSGVPSPAFNPTGSTFVIDGTTQSFSATPTAAAFLGIGTQAGFDASMSVRNAGTLRIDGSIGPGPFDALNIAAGGANASLTLTDSSQLLLAGNNPLVQVGRSGAGAEGSFSVLSGSGVSALLLSVGRDGSSGQMLIDGPGSSVTLSGLGTAACNAGVPCTAYASIGRSGTGTMTVSNGGSWLINDGGFDTRAAPSGPGLVLGRENTGSSGSLTITGSNSTVLLSSTSLGLAQGTPDNWNPYVNVGGDPGSSGSVTISSGGKLLLAGNAVSTLADTRLTALHIGAASATAATSGSVTVTGIGSQIALSGNSDLIQVGLGPGSVGSFNVLSGASVASTNLVIGDRGGNGSALVDGATVSLSGYRSDLADQGAGTTIGRGTDGSGSLTLSNNAQLTIVNDTAHGGLSIGGDRYYSGGTGSVSLLNGSSITSSGAYAGNVTVGYSGSGTLQMSGASSLDAGLGSIYVGRMSGSNGTMILSGASSATATYLGIATDHGIDAGNGTVVLTLGSLTAPTVEVGTNGILIAKSGLVTGALINRGTVVLDPPAEPGTLTIDGSFQNQSGGRLVLDVAPDGHSGFTTSHLVFTHGSTFDFSGALVTFDFLAGADPTAFLASGAFVLDSFLNSLGPDGVLLGLSSAFTNGQTYGSLFSASQFVATSDQYNIQDFVFSPDGTASFEVAAVPEPSSWVLMLLGLFGVAWAGRKGIRRDPEMSEMN